MRYIDADALVRAIRLYANRTSLGEICPPDLSYSETLDIIADAPTADVAPRAEIDKLQEVNADLNESLRLAAEANKDLQAKVDCLRFNLNAVLDERAEDKAEVAREIFAEIKEKGSFSDPCVLHVVLSFDELAEIEKKYTETEPPKGD